MLQASEEVPCVNSGSALLLQLPSTVSEPSFELAIVAPACAFLLQKAFPMVLVLLEGTHILISRRQSQVSLSMVAALEPGSAVGGAINFLQFTFPMMSTFQKLANVAAAISPSFPASSGDLTVLEFSFVEASQIEGEATLAMLLSPKPLTFIGKVRVRIEVGAFTFSLASGYRDLSLIPCIGVVGLTLVQPDRGCPEDRW
mmetsp:Transcript_24398/g.44197  ORF Transcript_24398/g.44197 Transcript_24398/m.44197 type:complete len:200 (-) Transcript_24398:35-634(-)